MNLTELIQCFIWEPGVYQTSAPKLYFMLVMLYLLTYVLLPQERMRRQAENLHTSVLLYLRLTLLYVQPFTKCSI